MKKRITTKAQVQAALKPRLHLLIKAYKRSGFEYSIGADLVDPEVAAAAIAEGLVEHVGCDLFGIVDNVQQFELAKKEG